MVKVEPLVRGGPDLYRVSSGIQTISVASKLRVRLYKDGIQKRINKVARIYGAAPLSGQMQGKTVIDVGANIGEFSMWAAQYGANVLAIEASKRTFKALEANAAGRSITPLNIALWNCEEERDLYECDADTSLIEPTLNAKPRKVMTRTLANVLAERKLTDIFFMKADVEGAEPELLEGAGESLRIIRHIGIDCGPERRKQTTAEASMAILRRYGFTVRRLPVRRHIYFAECV